MKIAVMVGSLRKESMNRKIFQNYRKIAGGGHQFLEVKVDGFPHYNSDLHEDGFPQDVENAAKTLKESDGLIFFTPEYNYSVPGFLKNALDWLSRLESKPFDNLPTTIVGASPGKAGTARMQYDLRKIGVFLNLHFMNRPEVMISQVQNILDDDGKISDESTVSFLKKHFSSFLQFIEKNKR